MNISMSDFHVFDGGETAPAGQRYLGKFFEGFITNPRTKTSRASWWPIAFHAADRETVTASAASWLADEIAKEERAEQVRLANAERMRAAREDRAAERRPHRPLDGG